MNRIDSMFAELKKQNKKALITFITAGDPDFDTTEQLILEMERQGANLIELGVPFSRPNCRRPHHSRSKPAFLTRRNHSGRYF